jgi:hypothetical protein
VLALPHTPWRSLVVPLLIGLHLVKLLADTDGDSRKINTNTAIINTTISLFLPHCHIIVHLLAGAEYNWFLLCTILQEIKQ